MFERDELHAPRFAKIYESLIGHPVFRNYCEIGPFVALIVLAQWKPETVRYKDRIIKLERGQISVSIRDFARKCGWEKTRVLRFFEKLENHTMIRRETAPGVTVITICNYEKYQHNTKTDAPPPHHEPHQDRTRTAPQNKNLKNSKKDIIRSPNGDPSVSDELETVKSAWNEMARPNGLTTIRDLTDARKSKLRQRIRDAGGLEPFLDAIRTIPQSSFLIGEDGRGWKADFDFVLQASKFTKLIEGTYHNRSTRDPPRRKSESEKVVELMQHHYGVRCKIGE